MPSILRGAIPALAQGGPFTVLRTSAGTWVAGKYIPSGVVAEITPVVASIQPTNGDEVMDLPEGQRGDEVLVVYTTTRLVARRRELDADPAVEPDRIRESPGATPSLLSGETWVVVRAQHFHAFDDYHCRAYIARREAP